MLAADVAEAAFDFVPDEMVAIESTDPIAVDEWQAWDPVVCDLQPYDFVDPKPAVDPVIIDDSSLLVEDSWLMVYEPIDIRVQFVSSETEPGWATYYHTVGVDGVAQGVSVWASYDEPAIAAFVAEHANDPAVLISDYGDGWWIDGFPLELAPPVPEQTVFYGGDQTALDEYADEGTVDPSGSFNITNNWSSSSFNVASGWSSSGTDAVLTWDGNAGFGGDELSTWDDSGELYIGDHSLLEFSDDWTGTFLPLAYARGADVSESFLAYAAAADAEPAEPVAVSPRSAAFADMGAMAAAMTATQASSADATSIGGRRRRR
jgi:hypothetical protein